MTMEVSNDSCTKGEVWWVSVATSGLLYAIGTLISFIILVLHKTLVHSGRCKPFWAGDFLKHVQQACQRCTSEDHPLGRFMTVFHIICNVAFCSLVIYRLYENMVECFGGALKVDIKVELVLSTLLTICFLVRFLGSSNIVLFWFNPLTIVDVFTVPNVFVACALYKDWVGFRPLRFIWLTQVSDVLKFSRRIRSTSIADIVPILIRFTCIWLTASGIICVLESTGDPWENTNPIRVTFREYTYYIMVTMSTVGYGDYSPKTAWGQTFITVFIVAGLAVFAVSLPVLVDPIIQYYRIASYLDFDNTRVQKHVLVCGHINATSVHEFLKEFLHPDHGDKQTHVVFVDPAYPSPEMKAVISKHHRSHFLLGSILSASTLHRARIKNAKACIILANRHCNDPVTEDTTSMFYLVSLKNTYSLVPVILQVLSTSSKEYVGNIQGWNPEKDVVLCLNELRLGILALNVVSPGASTLISNLFYSSGSLASHGWQNLYLEGAGNEVYEMPFSHSFDGLKFTEAVKMCYNKLNLMLIGVKNEAFYLNPSKPDITIHKGMLGYFIAKDHRSVQRVSVYCSKCHGSVVHGHLRPCRCMEGVVIENTDGIPLRTLASLALPPSKTSEGYWDQYYLSPSQQLEASILTEKQVLSDHVVLCVFAHNDSAVLGLHSFVAPLRRKSIVASELKPIVIVSCASYIVKEWANVSSFPMIYAVIGSPLDWSCLSKASIERCSSCFLLTALSGGFTTSDNGLYDKEAILCSLSLQKKLQSSSVFVITDLVQDSNVQFLDISDDDNEEELYQSEPFACGNAFAASVFNSVTTAAYHSPGTLNLIKHLINPEPESQKTVSSSGLCQKRLNASEYRSLHNFSDLHSYLLEKQLVCIALYRQKPGDPTKHYVITNPAPNLELETLDIAIVLTPSIRLQLTKEIE